MPDQYPAVHYHKSGTSKTVHSAEEAKKLGEGWSDKHSDIHLEHIRRASGGVAEVVVPVTRTRVESI